MSSPGDFGDSPLDDDEPSVLGASATIEKVKKKRTRQRVKRQRAAGTTEGGNGIEFIYEPHVAVIPPLRTYFSDLWDRRAFLVALARSEIRGSRANTTLGSLWALLDPLFMAAIYFFLFSVIRGGEGRGTEFVPLILSGILLFQLTGGAITTGGNSVRGGRTLMLNSTFPRALLPLSAVYRLVLGFLPAIPIILMALLMFNDGGPSEAFSAQLLWSVPLFALQIMISIGLALLISTLVVFFTDATNLMNYVSRVMLFSSPIIYPWDLLPESILTYIRWLPLFGLFANYQKIFSGIRPDFAFMATTAVWAVALVFLGFWVFLRYERQFANRI